MCNKLGLKAYHRNNLLSLKEIKEIRLKNHVINYGRNYQLTLCALWRDDFYKRRDRNFIRKMAKYLARTM